MHDKMLNIARINAAKELRAKKRRPNVNINGWREIRQAILERDGYLCRICGDDAGEHSLEVHHINYNRANNSSTNLVTLCRSCHKAIHYENYMPGGEDDYPAPWGDITDY